MAAEVAHQRRKLVVAAALDQSRKIALIAQLVGEPLAPSCAAAEGQCRVELVRARLDPYAQPLATRFVKGGLLQAAMTQHNNVPAEVAEHCLELGPQSFAHHRIEALTIVVHHPPGVAQPVLPAFQQGLEDVALVHLGVADQGNHLAQRPACAPALEAQIILDE